MTFAELVPEEYGLADLHRQRWHAELDLRSPEDVLGMGELRCRTPPRGRNALLTHLTAYNLIRRVMATAALEAGTAPRHVSFKETLQTVGQFLPHLLSDVPLERWLHALLAAVAIHRIGNRPDREEPRRPNVRSPDSRIPRARGRAATGPEALTTDHEFGGGESEPDLGRASDLRTTPQGPHDPSHTTTSQRVRPL